jgi:hypothetical protein
MMGKLEMKRWVFEQLLTKLELAKTDQDFTQALGAINTVVKIDPRSRGRRPRRSSGQARRAGGHRQDLGEDARQGDGRRRNPNDGHIPTTEDMMSQLEDEVAADLGGARKAKTTEGGEVEPSLKQRIGEGRRRLKDLMDGEK